MTALPVIERELRVQARLGFTYMLRVLAAVALMCVGYWFGVTHGFSPRQGAALFGWMNFTLVCAIWVVVPLLSADCISRERREGTVGLLFLTPLNAREIVLSKGLVHGLRAFTLLLAVLPVMTISFLLGGVSWRAAVLSALANFSCLCWALASGLLASSMSKSRGRALLLAYGMAGCFAVVLALLTGGCLFVAMHYDPGFRMPFPLDFFNLENVVRRNFVEATLVLGYINITDMEGYRNAMFGSLPQNAQFDWLLAQGSVAFVSMLGLLSSVLLAAWNLRRTWQEEPPSIKRVWLEQKLVSPIIAVGFFHRWLRRKLERNPIGWLQQRTWSGRLMTWGWFAVMISFYSAAVTSPNVAHLLEAVQTLLAWLLVLIMASSAAGSFQRERETRVLELLLISPMSAGQIISGRLRGLWGQFAPSLVLLLLVWVYMAGVFWERADLQLAPFICGAFVTLPVIGLYQSLKRKYYITAFIWTLMVGVVLPLISKSLVVDSISNVFAFIGYYADSWPSLQVLIFPSALRTVESPLFILVIQGVLALWIGHRLHKNLKNRDFAFSKGAE